MGIERTRQRLFTRASDTPGLVPLCEAAARGCTGRAVHWHHRKLRSRGGGNELANAMAVCFQCHEVIHRNPALSQKNGWILHAYQDPSRVPVLRRGVLTFLDND